MNTDLPHSFIKRLKIPTATELKRVVDSFSYFEKILFWILIVLFAISSLSLLSQANNALLVEIADSGGSLKEGIVGTPRFINPVLAISDADRDLSSLVYSGLLKATPEGTLIEDLASSYSVSEDGRVYDFTIKDSAEFHDGSPVTADDVVFTVSKALDPALKSPRRASWDGVRVEKVSDREVRFTLNRAYAPFLQNTTMGILPKHIWENVETEQFSFSKLNTDPIGSGPYKVGGIKKNSSGVPERYTLTAFKKYTLNRPYLNKVIIRFYPTEEALTLGFKKGDITSLNGISPEKVLELGPQRIERSPLPRIFALFFNQNTAQIFSHVEVRKAIDTAIDKERIINEVLDGYGTVISSPIPPESINREDVATEEDTASEEFDRTQEARDILSRNGWKLDEEEGVWTSSKKGRLAFTLSTSNVPELKAVAEIIKSELEAVNIPVTIAVYESGNLNQTVIRPREYQALLFGEVVGRELDLFAFWHSSQRNDPGLNIALYANITADKLLEDGRTLLDTAERDEKYLAFETEVKKDTPAVFLYSPDFIYILPQKIQGVRLGSVTTSGERFLNIHEWYIKTDKVWSIFSR